MVVRSFPVGVVLVVSALASLGLSAAQASYPGWSAYAAQQKAVQFRPWSRVDTKLATVQRQSQMRTTRPRLSGRAPSRRSAAVVPIRQRQQAVFSTPRAGARKAVPVTRGQELGLRFRPDDRASPYGQTIAPGEGMGADSYSEELQSQFRPTRRKRKPTYEELQAERAATRQPFVPAIPYPATPQPVPMYPGGFPRW